MRIRVKAFGLNRSELHTRLGLAGDSVTYPRVLGIEATGVVDLAPSGEFEPGQQVMTMMGGMGRTFDGGYAEYTCVPAGQVIPFRSDLDWATLGAVPEMLQTAYGSLTVGVGIEAGQSLLIRGGTSSVGMAAAVLAKRKGLRVLATTRSAAKAGALEAIGVDDVLVGDGDVAAQVRRLLPEGVDGAIELIGTPTLPDTLRSTRVHGTVCFTGMLSNVWTVEEFYPIDYLPTGFGSPPTPVRPTISRPTFSRDSSTMWPPVVRWCRSTRRTTSTGSVRLTNGWRRARPAGSSSWSLKPVAESIRLRVGGSRASV